MAKRLGQIAAYMLAMVMLVVCLPLREAVNAANLVKTETLEFSKKYNITCVDPGDYYHYKVVLPTSGKINLYMTKTGLDSDHTKGYVRFFDPNDMIFEEYNWECGNKSYSMDLIAGQYDLYFDAEESYHGNNINYQFYIDYEPSGETESESLKERNDAYTTATTYKSGKFKGQLAENDHIDVYKYKISKGGLVTLTYTPDFGKSEFKLEKAGETIGYAYNVQYGKNVYKFYLPAGTYFLTISGYGISGTYDFSIKTTPIKKVTLKSAKKYKKGKKRGFTVKYSKNSSCDGYQICYSLKKNCKSGNKYKNVTGNSKTSVTVKGLKKNKKYYVRVRAYKLDSNWNKIYSDWSNIKTVTVK